ncbi:MAG: AraC family transcriptional regulator, partial [Bacteroidetes bacterium]|nr:AraC family transcriptional regulator [Bacteroidota bacterium]
QGGARSLNYIVLYFFACAFQGIALCLLSFKIQKRDDEKFTAFIFINTFLIILLLLLVIQEFSNPIWMSYYTFLFHFGLFCWGPSTFFVLHHFLKNERRFYKPYFFGIAFSIALLFAIIQIFNLEWFKFLARPVLPPLTLANLLFIGTGFIYNFFLFARMFILFPSLTIYPKIDRSKLEIYTNSFYWLSFVTILLVPANVAILGFISGHPFFEDFHIIGLVFTVLVFAETFFIWRNPEVLKEVKQVAQTEDTSEWFTKLDNLMKSEKPYRNPELSVADLSEMLGAKPHVLSKVINEHCDKNFRDFLNKYRVEEFISLANKDEYKRYTFLALAQEVGFNSKSTFNLAFKKLTNQNPRDYFKSQETEEERG